MIADAVTPEDISLKIDEKEKEIIQTLNNMDLIEAACAKLKKEVIEKEIERDEMVSNLKRARGVLARQRSERDILQREFWRAKGR